VPLHLVTGATGGSHLHLIVWHHLPLGMFNLRSCSCRLIAKEMQGYLFSTGTDLAFQPRRLIRKTRCVLSCYNQTTVEPEMGTWLKRGCSVGWRYIGFVCWPANQPSALEWLSGMSSASLTYTLRLVRVSARVCRLLPARCH
jgi:hypothetical protein